MASIDYSPSFRAGSSQQFGTQHQAWIAGGAGITPFLSWFRSMTAQDMPECVDFFLGSDGPTPWHDEIRAIAARFPALRVHFTDTRMGHRLTPAHVVATVTAESAESVKSSETSGHLRALW